MKYELESIINRMKTAIGADNDYQLSNALKMSSGVVANWRKAKSPPWEACYEIHKQTNCGIEWLISGELENSDNLIDSDDYQKIYNAFMSVLTFADEVESIEIKTESQEVLDTLAVMLYKRITGKKELSKNKEKKVNYP